MQNKFIKIIFLVLIISLAIGIVSFMINDVSTLQNNYSVEDFFEIFEESNDPKYLLAANAIDKDTNKISQDLINSELVFQESEEFKYEIYTSKDFESNIDKYGRINNTNNTLRIKEKSNFRNLKTKVMIYVPKDVLLKTDIDIVNGYLVSEVSFDNLNIDMVNGSVDLSGPNSYDIDIDMTNGDLNFKFVKYDAKIKADMINGNVDIFDRSFVFGMFPPNEKEFFEILGSGKHNIDIDMTNGSVNIS